MVAELLQMNVEEDVEHPNELGSDEAKDKQEETLAIGHFKERWLQCRTRSQLGTDLSFQYRYIGNQSDEHN